jgi:hypothetical protein
MKPMRLLSLRRMSMIPMIRIREMKTVETIVTAMGCRKRLP